MATYNFNTTGSTEYLSENISASQATTWNITQSGDGSSYFTLETVVNVDGKYSTSSVKGASGSFTTSSGVTTLIADDYHMSAVIEKGGATITFTPAQYVSSSQMLVRGTGGEGILPPVNPELILDASNLSSYPGTGTTWFDISGNGRNATLENTPTWNAGGYFELDGTEDWFRADDTAGILDGDFTVETAIHPVIDDYWINVGRTVWSTHTAGYGNQLLFYILPDISGSKLGTLSLGFPQDAPITTGSFGEKWQLLTISRKGDDFKIYIDGELDNSFSNSSFKTGNDRLSLGQEWDATPSNWYKGKYGGAKVYDRALTQGEIWTNYQIFKNQYGV